MEALLVLVGLGVILGIPTAAFVALARSGRALREIATDRSALVELNTRLGRLEERLGRTPASARTGAEIETEIAAEPDGVVTRPLETGASPEVTIATVAPDIAVAPIAATPVAATPGRTSLPVDSPIMRMAKSREDARLSARTASTSTSGESVAAQTAPSMAVAEAPVTGPATDAGGSGPAPPPPPKTKSGAPRPRRDLEESLGTRWAVWIGGVTLALGGLFLVKYSIEQGVFGPRTRIASGLIFAALLTGAGEWLRRQERRFEFGGVPSAHIPSILTAAGAVTAFGAVWAAHALYGMLSETAAFIALGAVGLATLYASSLHGPALAALGLIGSYGTPFLIGNDTGNKLGLVIFLGAVSAVAFSIAHLKRKSWIAWSAILGHGLWGLLLVMFTLRILRAPVRDASAEALHLVIGLALAALFLVLLPGRRGDAASPLRPATLAGLAVPAGLLVLLAFLVGDQGSVFWSGLVAVAIMAAGACLYAGGAAGLTIAAATAVGVVGAWPGPGGLGLANIAHPFALIRLDFPLVEDRRIIWFAVLAAAFLAVPAILVLLGRRMSCLENGWARTIVAFSAALAPVALLTATIIRVNGLNQHLGAAALAAALMAGLAVLGEWLFREENQRRSEAPNPHDLAGAGAFLAAAAVALGLAIALALPRLWLAVGLAIASAGVAFVLTRRPAPVLASMSGMLATAAVGRVVFAPLLHDVGTWPILNWLLAAYGLPALAFACAAYWLRGREPARLRHTHEALAAVFATITTATEIRQYFTGADLLAYRDIAFGEISLGGGAAALLALAAVEAARRQTSRVISRAALMLVIAAALISLYGLGYHYNPLFSGDSVAGTPPFNLIGWGYGLPLAATALAAWRLSRVEGGIVAAVAQALAAALAAGFVLLQTRRGFQGPALHWARGVTFAEGGVYATGAFLGAAALAWLRDRVTSPVFAPAALAAAIAGLAIQLIGPAIALNPFLRQQNLVGSLLFDNAAIGFLLPALAAALAAWRFGAKQREGMVAALTVAVVGGGAYVAAEIRRFYHGVDIHWTQGFTLAEGGTQVAAAFAAVAALAWLGSRQTPPAYGRPALAAAILGMLLWFALPGIGVNPILVGPELTGRPFFDNALIGYGLPAVLAALAAWLLGLARFAPAIAAGGVAIVSALGYGVVEIRRAFQGPLVILEAHDTTDAEWYAYSVLLVAAGIGLLALGFVLKNRPLRLASAIIIMAATLKVFIYDMAGLEGIMRALSFMGLGLTLVGIGLVYQRVLARQRKAADETPDAEEQAT